MSQEERHERTPLSESQEGWTLPRDEEIPRPTYSPAMLAMGLTLMAWGVVTSWVFSIVGMVLFLLALKSWIGEMIHGE